MNVTSKISVDLTRQNVGQRVNAVQGDGNTRLVEITLLCGGAPWTPPDGVEAAIAYMQPSGTKGMYNLLADGTAAISVTGNVATAILAPQMLTVSGTVQASLVFNDQRLNRLTTFPFAVSVASNPAAGAQKTEDYIRLQWLEDKLQALKDSGSFNGAPGVAGPPGPAGADGAQGPAGADGVGIQSVEQTTTSTEDGGTNVITVTKTDGTSSTFAVRNGSRGSVGPAGADGKPGADGAPGPVGATPNIQIGTVETLAAGSPATASMGGTPENPLLNLGIPQGAPGSGGSGIAVTGAAVGQTVRIAAVDDDGVPTAWEAVDLPSGGGGEAITAPLDIIASGTIPAGAKAWTNVGDIGVTWGDLKQYKSIGVLWNNGTDYLVLDIIGLSNWQRIQMSARTNRFYTIFRFADTGKTKIQFDMCAGSEFWITNVDQVTLANKWSGNAYFNPAIVQTKFSDAEKISFVPNADTTVDSTWYIVGITRSCI